MSLHYAHEIINDDGKIIAIVVGDEVNDENTAIANLFSSAPELLDALMNLQSELHKNRKMNVRKDFSLMVADAQASNAIYHAKGGK